MRIYIKQVLKCFSKPIISLKKLKDKKRTKPLKNRAYKVKKVSSLTEEKIIQTVVELYKFNGTFGRMLTRVPEEDAQRYKSKYQWFSKKVIELADSINIQVQDFTGMDFDPGLPITVINLEEFNADDELVISQMLEPAIIKAGKLVKVGTAMVKEKV